MKKIYELIKNLYAVDELCGYTEQEVDFMKQLFGEIPQVLEEFYRTAARTDALHHVQDTWMLPEHFEKYNWLKEEECLILLNENQGVCRAGIRREDLGMQDPPVYVSDDDTNWVICAETTSEFLAAAIGFEAPFALKFTPEEFYCLTKEELAVIESKLTKLPYEMKNWLYNMNVTLYSNALDNIVVVMDCDGDLQMLYGAASKESYDKLMEVMEGIGEAM